MLSRERLIAACGNQPVDRPPVWLMRQAGRYLPEYRAVREKHSFWKMVRTPELAVEVSLQPIRRFGMDAAILFSDILVVLDAMGFEVEYGAQGPVVNPLVQEPRDLERLTPTPAEQKLSYVGESLALLSQELHPAVAVIGFAGAPFTLAAYAIEHGPGRSLDRLQTLAWQQPDVYEQLLSSLVDVVVDLLVLQIKAGADMVQLFDTWAGRLSAQAYLELAQPYTKRVIERLQGLGAPIALYVRNAAANLESAAASGCSVLAVDESLPLKQARLRLRPGVALQGNFDPDQLHKPVDQIRLQVHEMITDAGSPGYVVNLGRGLSPGSPVEGVQAMVGAVQEWSA